MMQNSGKKEKMATRVLPKPLRFENYDFFFNNPVSSASTLNFHQLNQIVQIHGFYKLNHENRRKEMVMEALSGIDEFINPHCSTLDETLRFNNGGLTIDEVNDDLDALQWQEFSVQHFQSLSYNDNDHDNNGSAHLEELKPRKRVRKVKEKKVFDMVYSTRPRSMKSQKRRNINEIGLSACLV